MKPAAVVLDAMGVLYESADDVAELLVPYLREHGAAVRTEEIQEAYVRCSLGEFTSQTFWSLMGVAESATDEDYCTRHTLMPGSRDFLAAVSDAGVPLACLSNDVSAWSRQLRRRFGLDAAIREWVVSGDVGHRKPDAGIYHELLRRLDVPATAVWFVDDRPKNVAAARALGITSIEFGRDVTSFDDLTRMVSGWT
jgi:putative hydrolase of the HAD superfamily